MRYCIDPTATEPIMLIDTFIGEETDADGIKHRGVMGDEFSRELMFLDSLNKKTIHVWINSEGGSVVDAEQIYGTILKTKTPVDTHCVGMAASSAFCIWLAGRNRYMMDYAKGMTHQVAGGDAKSREAFERAVNTMISSRTDLTPQEVKTLMDATTWLSAQDLERMGMCKIEDSGSMNRPRKTPGDGVKAMYEEYRSIVNKLVDTKKTIIMEKVTNRLNLVAGSKEEVIVEAINKLEKGKTDAETAHVTAKADAEAKNTALVEMTNKYNTLKADVDAKAAAEATNRAAAEKAKLEADAKTLVADGVKTGKIVNKAEVIESYEKLAIADMDGTKKVIEALPVTNKSSAKLNESEDLTNQVAKEVMEARPSIDMANPDGYFQKMQARKMVEIKNRVHRD